MSYYRVVLAIAASAFTFQRGFGLITDNNGKIWKDIKHNTYEDKEKWNNVFYLKHLVYLVKSCGLMF